MVRGLLLSSPCRKAPTRGYFRDAFPARSGGEGTDYRSLRIGRTKRDGRLVFATMAGRVIGCLDYPRRSGGGDEGLP